MNEQRGRKLVEVALPLEAINLACKADKDRKVGTIRNLHKWFAPMPVPALRALIFAALVDCPEEEPDRQKLLRLIEELVESVVDDPPASVLERAIDAVHRSNSELPTVVDPFCGAGSTLVEAQRLGLRSCGSDLNPIPVLISKALTEIPPMVRDLPPITSGTQDQMVQPASGLTGFVSDVEEYARRVYEAAEARVAKSYPPLPRGERVIAWLWTRTVPSPDPAFRDASTPIASSWQLSSRRGDERVVVPIVDRTAKAISFGVGRDGAPSTPGKERCLFSDAPLSFDYIRRMGREGRLGLRLMAVAAAGPRGRIFVAPDPVQESVALSCRSTGLADLEIPERALSFRVQQYGFKTWSDLFTARQQLELETFADLVRQVPDWVRADGGSDTQARAIGTVLGLCVGKLAQAASSLVKWRAGPGSSKAELAISRHDVSPLFDFAETNPFGRSVGDWMQVVETALRAFNHVHPSGPAAEVVQADARNAFPAMQGNALVVTDPPYFSAIGYANVADYFYPWLRRTLDPLYPELFRTIGTPKSGELIAEPARHSSPEDARDYFVDGFVEVFTSLRRASRKDLPLLIVYAFKEPAKSAADNIPSGWEAMLEAVIQSGLSIVGTWPVHGTSSSGIRDLKANVLATYVVLVCRQGVRKSGRIDRGRFVHEVRDRLREAVRDLQATAVAPVDLAQAVIGPGMSIYCQYDEILGADGRRITVREALLQINAVLSAILDEQEGDLDPETRWALTWFEQMMFQDAPSGRADGLARAKVTTLERLEMSGILKTEGGRARLLRRSELPETYVPDRDRLPTVWEATHHLINALERGGEAEASELLARLMDSDRAKELAYHLFDVCLQNGWAEEARGYNALVVSWPEIARLAVEQRRSAAQQVMGA